MKSLKTLSLIIPVFNEEKTIGEIIEKVIQAKLPSEIKKEIIVVDDGSSDQSFFVAEELLQRKQSEVKNFTFQLIRQLKNQGKGSAVKSGINMAKGDYLIIQDADLEYDPNQIVELLQPILAGKAEVVYGTRLKRFPNIFKEEKTFRFFLHYLGNRFLSLLTSLFYGQWITDMETGYKIFPKSAVSDMKLEAEGFEFEPEITAKLLKKGYHILEIPITTNPRSYDEGKKLNTIKDGIKAVKTVFKYKFI